MKRIFQNLLMVLAGVSFIMLSGCPKKVAPVKKTSRIVRPSPSGKLRQPVKPVEKKPPVEENIQPVIPPPLVEEEIPSIAKLEEPQDSLLNDKKDLNEKASGLKDILFDLDQWVIRPNDLPLIEENANWIISHPNKSIRLEGHGDSRGTNEYNLVLGEKRADAVKDSMVKMGVDSERLTVISYGEERPFCTTEDESCYQENRRVHFYVEE